MCWFSFQPSIVDGNGTKPLKLGVQVTAHSFLTKHVWSTRGNATRLRTTVVFLLNPKDKKRETAMVFFSLDSKRASRFLRKWVMHHIDYQVYSTRIQFLVLPFQSVAGLANHHVITHSLPHPSLSRICLVGPSQIWVWPFFNRIFAKPFIFFINYITLKAVNERSEYSLKRKCVHC